MQLKGVPDGSVTASPHISAYLVAAPSCNALESLLHLCLDDPTQVHLKICDFSESFIFDPTAPVPRPTNTPNVYRDPQTMFNDRDAAELVCLTPAVDMWALTPVFHQLLATGLLLFCSSYGNKDEVLLNMVLVLGMFPEPYWSRCTSRRLYYDDNERWIGDEKKLRKNAGTLLEIWFGAMDVEERGMFEDLLTYDVSPWFVECCKDVQS